MHRDNVTSLLSGEVFGNRHLSHSLMPVCCQAEIVNFVMLGGHLTFSRVFKGLLMTAKLVSATWGHGGLCWPGDLFAAHAPSSGPGATDVRGHG